jgi:hypothetical protein
VGAVAAVGLLLIAPTPALLVPLAEAAAVRRFMRRRVRPPFAWARPQLRETDSSSSLGKNSVDTVRKQSYAQVSEQAEDTAREYFMRLIRAGRGAAFLTMALTVLAACAANTTPDANALEQVAQPTKASELLYVSAQNGLYVFTYPGGKLRQKLTGYGAFGGLCVDKSGDVFAISEGSGAEIYEFAHGGSSPKAILREHNSSFDASPTGCAIDPITGNLAVANSPYTTANDASVGIFENASGEPMYYTDYGISTFAFCAYDDKGDLYVDGQGNYFTKDYDDYIAELPHGSSSFTNASVAEWLGTSDALGGVQWDGKHLAVGNEDQTIYQFSIAGSKATEVGKTVLGKVNSVNQFWIERGEIIGGNDVQRGSIDSWQYPGGGSPLATIVKRVPNPLAVVISK